MISKIEQYYQNTENCNVHENVKELAKRTKVKDKVIIDLGCGAGRDSIFLAQHKARVIGIDRENVEERIRKKLSEEEQKYFIFQRQKFEEIQLQKCNAIIANYSLFFCQRQKFFELWRKIGENLIEGGIFVGTFIGPKDSWARAKEDVFTITRQELLDLFRNFKILKLEEKEQDKKTGLGQQKHWHIYEIIARKK